MTCEVCQDKKGKHIFTYSDCSKELVCDECYRMLLNNKEEMQVIKNMIFIKKYIAHK